MTSDKQMSSSTQAWLRNRQVERYRVFFRTGGTLEVGDPSYLVRAADKILYQAIQDGEYSYILTARQMGKSSLMVQTAARLRAEGDTVVVIDLTALGSLVTAEQWYYSLAQCVGARLELEDKVDNYWDQNMGKSPLQRWLGVVTRIALPRCRQRLVIFVDEVDYCRSLPFSSDEFFAGIRQCFNERTQNPDLARLSFHLLGVASPAELVRETRTTPFNVGRRILLEDFALAEVKGLQEGLNRAGVTSPKVLDRVMHWTRGHPYLTQRMCFELAQTEGQRTPAEVDALCTELFLSPNAADKDDNLVFVRSRALHMEEGQEKAYEDRLLLYRDIWKRKRVLEDLADPRQEALLLSGLVSASQGQLFVRNRIYRRVFGKSWVNGRLTTEQSRQSRRATHRGMLAVGIPALILIVYLVFKLLS